MVLGYIFVVEWIGSRNLMFVINVSIDKIIHWALKNDR